jgi:hypothetical protein
MLGNSMRRYVISENKNGYSKAVQSVYNSRIKKYAKQALQDLVLLANKLPEDQQEEIFTEITIGPLFRAVLKQSPEEMNRLFQDKAQMAKKRKRLLPICYELITWLNHSNLSHLIAPIGSRYMIKEGGHLAHLKAVYYRSLNERDDEE